MSDAELLEKLVTAFYVSSTGGVYWSYIESTTVADVLGKETQDELKKRIEIKKNL